MAQRVPVSFPDLSEICSWSLVLVTLTHCLVALSVFILSIGARTQKNIKSGPTLYLERFSFPFCNVIGISLCFLVFCLSLDFLKAQTPLRRKQTLVRFLAFL